MGETNPTTDEAWNEILSQVPIGPGGRHPNIALPRILNFLLDEDVYKHPQWDRRLEEIIKYLNEADEGRLRGDLGYDDPYTLAALEDALILVDLHQRYYKRNSNPTPWTSRIIPGQRVTGRLPNFPGQSLTQPALDRMRNKHKRYDQLREVQTDGVFPELSARGGKAVEYYQNAEELYFENCLKPGTYDNRIFNGFRNENDMYERCIVGGVEETCKLIPPRPADQVPTVFDDDLDATYGTESERLRDLTEFYEARGWQRAAVQQCLNMLTNYENKVLNTPWRRVVLPYEQPNPALKEIIYQPRALPPERVHKSLREPYPWVYWYNQHEELIQVLAGWQRRRYNLENWTDFQRAALPANFHGPYVDRNLSVYNSHWLEMGAYLKRLRKRLEDTFGIAPRPFLLAILRDIQAGIEWRPNPLGNTTEWSPDEAEYPRQARRDIMRRPKIDWVELDPSLDLPPTILLLDESDAAWLKYLCQPSRSEAMCNPEKQPVDNLTILFDERLQDFLNNPGASDSPGTAGIDIFEPNVQQWKEETRNTRPLLDEALAYINGGGDAGKSHANETYRFLRSEAIYHLEKLRKLGRVQYVEIFDRNKPREEREIAIIRPKYQIHPENRVYWRHESQRAFRTNQDLYREAIVEHLENKYGLSSSKASIETEELKHILDHLGDDTLPDKLVGSISKNGRPEEGEVTSHDLLQAQIQPEIGWVQGSYPEGGPEERRNAPSWSDLVDWETLGKLSVERISDDIRSEIREEAMKMRRLPVPERTVQFFRNLAYRMGRTIAHVEEIERRLQYAAYDDGSGIPKSREWKAISTEASRQAYEHWHLTIQNGVGPIEFLPPTMEDVVNKGDPDGLMRREFRGLSAADIIREGIINNCVENRNTMYPGRIETLEDSSGFYINDSKFKPNKILSGYKRPSLFKWATQRQRRYQAPYTRGIFFHMLRWPVHLQSERLQEFIRQRQDEVERVEPSLPSQSYGILMARFPERLVERVTSGLTRYPGPNNRWSKDQRTKGTTSENVTKTHVDTKDPERNDVSEQTKAPIDTKHPSSTKPAIETSTQEVPQAIPPVNHSETPQTAPEVKPQDIPQSRVQEIPRGENEEGPIAASAIPVEPQRPSAHTDDADKMAATQKPATATATAANKPLKQPMVPITKPEERFVPGPAIFPMAETPLQTVVLSRQLEDVVYPQSPLNLWGKVRKVYKAMTDVEPPQIPLLPPTPDSDIPRSTSRKRKIPADFILASAAQGNKRANTGTDVKTPKPTVPPANRRNVTPWATPRRHSQVDPVDSLSQSKKTGQGGLPTQQQVTPPVTPARQSQTTTQVPQGQTTTQVPHGQTTTQAPQGRGNTQIPQGQVPATQPAHQQATGSGSISQAHQDWLNRESSGLAKAKSEASHRWKYTPLPGLESKMIAEEQAKTGRVVDQPFPPAPQHNTQGENPHADNEALRRAFPNGWAPLGPSFGLDGALHAICNSMRLQDSKNLWLPAMSALRASYDDPDCFVGADKTVTDQNHYGLTIIQAEAALQHYVRHDGPNPHHVQLCCIIRTPPGGEFYTHFVPAPPFPGSEKPRQVWIYCTGANEFGAVFPVVSPQ
ncbi:uncharacterized protein F4812DRAFT_461595 [Daldinia caldariorum]|uniref:uncharacterized protein n=1 Tax=Daldinia caldariorum TaxID=326644 RepID=UPI0020088BCF|nr:uncharacterized protein F4812DRAFT_461595 [Daldinia caldariorum]KAI1465289.1 hypothetical protein F4812DRAFT_461595 [Daldinia caldariorum]